MLTEQAASTLRTITLSGSERARGRRHGELLGAQVQDSGILDFYLGYCERHLLARGSTVGTLALGALHAWIARRFSPESRALIEGFAEGAGIPAERVARAHAMPDALNYLTGTHYRRAAGLGCTSVAAWGEYTEGGRFLYGRNLDFPGNGYFDRAPLVARHRPERGLPYVSFGTAGTVVDGITGINAEGLTVALHQHLSAQTAVLAKGRPVLDLGRQLLAACRTLEEAAELCARWPTTSGWTVVLTHWRSRRALAVERTAARCALTRYETGSMARTNEFCESELRASEADYPGFRDSSRARARRAEDLLEEQRGRLDPARLAALLADRFDPLRGRRRAFAGVIAQPHCVSSVVLDPEAGLAWVSEGRAPACEGPHRKVALWEDSEPGEALPRRAEALPPAEFEASRRYLEAFANWSGRRDTEAACAALEEAVRLAPEDPLYRHMHGVLALKCGRAARAEESLAAGAELPDLAHRSRAQRLWRARALDLLGRRAAALAVYRGLAAERNAAPALRAAAALGERAAYRAEALGAVLPDFIFGDCYSY